MALIDIAITKYLDNGVFAESKTRSRDRQYLRCFSLLAVASCLVFQQKF